MEQGSVNNNNPRISKKAGGPLMNTRKDDIISKNQYFSELRRENGNVTSGVILLYSFKTIDDVRTSFLLGTCCTCALPEWRWLAPRVVIASHLLGVGFSSFLSLWGVPAMNFESIPTLLHSLFVLYSNLPLSLHTPQSKPSWCCQMDLQSIC